MERLNENSVYQSPNEKYRILVYSSGYLEFVDIPSYKNAKKINADIEKAVAYIGRHCTPEEILEHMGWKKIEKVKPL